MEEKNTRIRTQHAYLVKLTLAAMFLALGFVLPFVTGQIPQLGQTFLPMHLPILLCGLICGWPYAAAIGFVLPLLRFALFSVPPMPGTIPIAFELATYGLVIGLVYGRFKRKHIGTVYVSLLSAMVAGRVVSGLMQMVVYGVIHTQLTWKMYIGGAFLNALPGIVLQLVLIPTVMLALGQMGLVPFERK